MCWCFFVKKTSSRIIILDAGVSDYVNQFTWLVNMGLVAERQVLKSVMTIYV